MYIFMCVRVYVCLCVCLCIGLHVLHMYMYVCIYTCIVHMYACAYLYICLRVCPSQALSVSVPLSVGPFARLFVCLSACLPIGLYLNSLNTSTGSYLLASASLSRRYFSASAGFRMMESSSLSLRAISCS